MSTNHQIKTIVAADLGPVSGGTIASCEAAMTRGDLSKRAGCLGELESGQWGTDHATVNSNVRRGASTTLKGQQLLDWATNGIGAFNLKGYGTVSTWR